MNYDALIIIDMQTALVEAKPYNKETVVANIQNLLNACRKIKIPVIFIQHDGGVGDELEHGSSGWKLCSELTPLPGEKIIEKQYNSAFRGTGLREHLDAIGAKKLILCGMQTEYCVDVSCKVAFEFGYDITIPQKATTTFDNSFASGKDLSEYYETKIWANRFAKVISTPRLISEI